MNGAEDKNKVMRLPTWRKERNTAQELLQNSYLAARTGEENNHQAKEGSKKKARYDNNSEFLPSPSFLRLSFFPSLPLTASPHLVSVPPPLIHPALRSRPPAELHALPFLENECPDVSVSVGKAERRKGVSLV
ncbi:hypothetical protein E2C01_003993 [Portunus trituberculatus]|uniref:Uncharacterized protein n=1 Tax=Portunus trituberculatus TaxID=210409 RepID=A0A5B7CPC2_PORTR|nr:hypothetical protein [Portunus trituberculatus]